MTQWRLLLPALLFGIFFCAVAVKHVLLAGPRKAHYLEAGRKIALVQNDYYPPRARLLDAGGTPLAWSERYFDLIWRGSNPPPEKLLQRLNKELNTTLVPTKSTRGKRWLLRRNLTPDELLKTAPIQRKTPDLIIHSRVERIVVNIAAVRKKVGWTRQLNGEMQGVSGWEKEYDAQLRGTPGRYEVMLDRRRRWIDSTWKLLTPPIPGKDVQVPFRLEDMQ